MKDSFEFDVRHVANLLKSMINSVYDEGVVPYPEIGEMPNMVEIGMAIVLIEREEHPILTVEVPDE